MSLIREASIASDSNFSESRISSADVSSDRSAAACSDQIRHWIHRIADVCEQAAHGNLEARLLHVDVDGDLARMIHGINALLDNTDAFIREAKASLAYAAKGKFFRRVVLRGMAGTFKHASQLINSASEEMEKQSLAISDAVVAREMMANEFEQTVQGVANSIAAAATHMQSTSGMLSQSMQQTSEQLNSALESAQRTVGNVQQTIDSTNKLTTTATNIEQKVHESAGVVRRAVSEADEAGGIVTDLNRSSTNIDDVVRTISQIAKQTNILALNASIEAARAGEAGRAFAIVATEVKQLAQQTEEATRQVDGEIRTIQGRVQNAVNSIVKFSKTIRLLDSISESISQSVSEQSHATEEIHQNVDEVAQRTDEVTENIDRVSKIAGQTSQSLEDVLRAANDLSQQSETLNGAVQQFLQIVRGAK